MMNDEPDFLPVSGGNVPIVFVDPPETNTRRRKRLGAQAQQQQPAQKKK